jgi:hypothetical protein
VAPGIKAASIRALYRRGKREAENAPVNFFQKPVDRWQDLSIMRPLDRYGVLSGLKKLYFSIAYKILANRKLLKNSRKRY